MPGVTPETSWVGFIWCAIAVQFLINQPAMIYPILFCSHPSCSHQQFNDGAHAKDPEQNPQYLQTGQRRRECREFHVGWRRGENTIWNPGNLLPIYADNAAPMAWLSVQQASYLPISAQHHCKEIVAATTGRFTWNRTLIEHNGTYLWPNWQGNALLVVCSGTIESTFPSLVLLNCLKFNQMMGIFHHSNAQMTSLTKKHTKKTREDNAQCIVNPMLPPSSWNAKKCHSENTLWA